jgi:hypothetical protein
MKCARVVCVLFTLRIEHCCLWLLEGYRKCFLIKLKLLNFASWFPLGLFEFEKATASHGQGYDATQIAVVGHNCSFENKRISVASTINGLLPALSPLTVFSNTQKVCVSLY